MAGRAAAAGPSENSVRRQRLDDEHRALLDPSSGELLASYGSSLITVIFNVETLVDATLFFIGGGHLRYQYIRKDDADAIHEVRFVNPRVPVFFMNLLQSTDGGSMETASARGRNSAEGLLEGPPDARRSRRGGQRARKRCAFFTMLITRTGSDGEPLIVHLAADVKLFHYTAHVCGLRNIKDAQTVMRFIHEAFTNLQNQLNIMKAGPPPSLSSLAIGCGAAVEEEEGEAASASQVAADLLSGGDPTRRAFLEVNTQCCSLPLIVSEGDVVMTNLCGRFPTPLNLRATFHTLSQEYPGVLTYLTTMSKSNYLVVTLFEHAPFEPLRTRHQMTADLQQQVQTERVAYLMSSKRLRSRHRKHTFFIYASGRFIQSSRNNATALSYTERCMKLLHAVSTPVLAEVEESEGGGEEEEAEEAEIDE